MTPLRRLLSRALRYVRNRKRAERAQHPSDRQYEQLFDAHPDPLWVYDQETYEFLAANAAAVRQYGWTREEFLAMKVPDLLPPEESPDLLSALAMARRDQAVRTLGSGGVWTHSKKDGTRIEVEGASSPLRFAGRPARLILAIDVTDRRRFEERLVETEKMEALAQLAGGIAHDFDDLLATILAQCELLAAQAGGPAAGIEPIRRAARQAADRNRQLLTFSRKRSVALSALDLEEELAAIAPRLRSLLGETIELAVSAAPGLWRVRADPGELEQLLLGLAANARDAMPQGGRLEIVAANALLDEAYVRTHPGAAPGPYVELAVGDSGEGIEPETLTRIFEPFFTTKPAGQGAGLGLAMVHAIVTRSGGHLRVESVVGKGTAFHLFLPRAEEPPASRPL